MIDLPALASSVQELAPLPPSATRLVQLAGDPDADMDDFAEVIAFDPALTMKVLRAANSAASGSALRVTSVREAVSRMGVAQVVTFAVATHARGTLSQAVPGYDYSENQLWRHSVFAALAAECTSRACRIRVPPEAFTAALLHDIGKLVLGRFLTEGIVAQLREVRTRQRITSWEAEREVLKADHAAVGARVAEHWNIPGSLTQAIEFHHDPGNGPDELCCYVYLANLAANHIEPTVPEVNPEQLTVDAEVVAKLGLADDALAALSALTSERFAEVSARYSAA